METPACFRGHSLRRKIHGAPNADEHTVVRADTLPDAFAMPEVMPIADSRNQIAYRCIQLGAWTMRKPLARALLQPQSEKKYTKECPP
jgi:hypothetical protein